MKIPAKDLKSALRKVSSVSPDQLIFAGRELYGVGQNITVIAGLTVDLGTFAIGAERFRQVVSRLDGELDLVSGEKLTIKAGRSRFSLPVLAECKVPQYTFNAGLGFDGKKLLEMLEFASIASAKEVFSYAGCLCFTGVGAIGTDGNRLAVFTSEQASVDPFLLPLPVLAAAKTLDGPKISIWQDATSICLSSGGDKIIARKLVRSFPNYESIIPKTYLSKHRIKAEEMLAGLRKISPLLDEESKRISLTFSPESLILSLSSSAGTATDEISVDQIEPDPVFNAEKYVFSLDCRALQDFYEMVRGPTVVCGNGTDKPVWIESGPRKILLSSKG